MNQEQEHIPVYDPYFPKVFAIVTPLLDCSLDKGRYESQLE